MPDASESAFAAQGPAYRSDIVPRRFLYLIYSIIPSSRKFVKLKQKRLEKEHRKLQNCK